MKNLKLCLVAIVTLAVCSNENGQTYSKLSSKADSLYRVKDFENSAKYYEKAFEIQIGNSSDYYNAACSWALAGNKEKAFKNLNLAVDKGWLYLDHTQKDSDLVSLHNEKEWKSTIAKLEKKVDEFESGLNKELIEELKEIGEKDQRYRKQMREISDKYGWQSNEMKELWKKQNELDSLNLIRIEEIIEKYGYPGKSLVGMQSNVAFLVIQHSDIETQEKYLPILKEAADKGELRWSSLALLIDRIRVNNGEKQIYGSQIRQSGDWKHELFPIEDEPNVNKRRAKVGLGPLEEYVKHWNIIYVPKKSKK